MKIIESIHFDNAEERQIQQDVQPYLGLAEELNLSEDDSRLLRRATSESTNWTQATLLHAAEVLASLKWVAQRRADRATGLVPREHPLFLNPELLEETIRQTSQDAIKKLDRLIHMLIFAANSIRAVPEAHNENADENDEPERFLLIR